MQDNAKNPLDRRIHRPPREWKITALRECALPYGLIQCQSPEVAAEYWRKNIESAEYYDPNRECFVALLLDTRFRIKGHHLVAIGTLDSVHTHAREAYRAAVIGSAHSIILMHHLCATTHKLCYVAHRVMCSFPWTVPTATRATRGKERHA